MDKSKNILHIELQDFYNFTNEKMEQEKLVTTVKRSGK